MAREGLQTGIQEQNAIVVVVPGWIIFRRSPFPEWAADLYLGAGEENLLAFSPGKPADSGEAKVNAGEPVRCKRDFGAERKVGIQEMQRAGNVCCQHLSYPIPVQVTGKTAAELDMSIVDA